MLFYNFLIILSKNHLITDDQDGSDSISEGRPVSHKHKQLKTIKISFYFHKMSII